ncbi:MAG: hypothetical protein ABL889_03580 [Terricaulis sp.]
MDRAAAFILSLTLLGCAQLPGGTGSTTTPTVTAGPPLLSPEAISETEQSRDPVASMPGSDEAKDDLYCWAVLGNYFEDRDHFGPNEADRLISAQRRLEASGVAMLTREGVTDLDNWASLTVAYAETARADYRNNTLRISVAACLERAAVMEHQQR